MKKGGNLPLQSHRLLEVTALFDKQTGCQSELVRTQGHQEADCRRLSRLIHNLRLAPKAKLPIDRLENPLEADDSETEEPTSTAESARQLLNF